MYSSSKTHKDTSYTITDTILHVDVHMYAVCTPPGMQVYVYVHTYTHIHTGTYTHMDTQMHTLTIGHKVHYQHSTVLQKVVILTHRPDTSSVGHTLSDVSDHYSCVSWTS